MRLIDADKLEKIIEMTIKTNDMIAEAYGIQHEDFAKLQKGIMRNVLEIVKKQPTVELELMSDEH